MASLSRATAGSCWSRRRASCRSTRARHESRRAANPERSLIGAGIRVERPCAFLEQDLHALACFGQAAVALARQGDTLLEQREGFGQSQIAALEPHDECFEFSQRLLEIGRGGLGGFAAGLL